MNDINHVASILTFMVIQWPFTGFPKEIFSRISSVILLAGQLPDLWMVPKASFPSGAKGASHLWWCPHRTPETFLFQFLPMSLSSEYIATTDKSFSQVNPLSPEGGKIFPLPSKIISHFFVGDYFCFNNEWLFKLKPLTHSDKVIFLVNV